MTPTIIVVEDELLIAKDISMVLEKEGYKVIMNITSVEQAIEAIEIYNPNLVLLDINLKHDKDGIHLGEYLRKTHTIPFVYITSSSDNVTLDRIKDTNPDGIIIKPFKSSDIRTTVSVVLHNFKNKQKELNKDEEAEYVPFVLKEVVNYINENIEHKIDVKILSSMTKYNHLHFIRIFNKYLGTTPYQYILKKKIQKAKELIVDDVYSLVDISVDLGFLSYSNFSKIFKRETNYTPDQYRKIFSKKFRIT
ncbi:MULTISPECIES: response regulator transcription factor [Flavobacterium]|uniref:Response regulator transcription factor n=1 Tax=Flavobacterium keumense TaxID=1306518 RepID=A0ABY8N703_9FLAO|nr:MULTISPECIES: response regulator transcription factor [Flavobacterium]WGK94391.1 response regulator transcription factor [Flavobacterium keumense]